MSHFPLPFAGTTYYTKINKYDGFNRGKILEKSCFLVKTEVRFWPLYGGDTHILD